MLLCVGEGGEEGGGWVSGSLSILPIILKKEQIIHSYTSTLVISLRAMP